MKRGNMYDLIGPSNLPPRHITSIMALSYNHSALRGRYYQNRLLECQISLQLVSRQTCANTIFHYDKIFFFRTETILFHE